MRGRAKPGRFMPPARSSRLSQGEETGESEVLRLRGSEPLDYYPMVAESREAVLPLEIPEDLKPHFTDVPF